MDATCSVRNVNRYLITHFIQQNLHISNSQVKTQVGHSIQKLHSGGGQIAGLYKQRLQFACVSKCRNPAKNYTLIQIYIKVNPSEISETFGEKREIIRASPCIFIQKCHSVEWDLLPSKFLWDCSLK